MLSRWSWLLSCPYFVFLTGHLLQPKALGCLSQAASTCQLPVGCLRLDLLCVCDLPPVHAGRCEAVEEGRGCVGRAGKAAGPPGVSSLGRPSPSEGSPGKMFTPAQLVLLLENTPGT